MRYLIIFLLTLVLLFLNLISFTWCVNRISAPNDIEVMLGIIAGIVLIGINGVILTKFFGGTK